MYLLPRRVLELWIWLLQWNRRRSLGSFYLATSCYHSVAAAQCCVMYPLPYQQHRCCSFQISSRCLLGKVTQPRFAAWQLSTMILPHKVVFLFDASKYVNCQSNGIHAMIFLKLYKLYLWNTIQLFDCFKASWVCTMCSQKSGRKAPVVLCILQIMC